MCDEDQSQSPHFGVSLLSFVVEISTYLTYLLLQLACIGIYQNQDPVCK